MSSNYKTSKINDNALTKCNKCDCMILSDSSDSRNDKCIHPSKFYSPSGRGDQLGMAAPSIEDAPAKNTDGFCNGFCRNGVKIVIQRPDCDDDSSKDKSTSDSDNNNNNKQLRDDYSMKHICFRLCRKKKDNNKASPPEIKQSKSKTGAVPPEIKRSKSKTKEDTNQTSNIDVKNAKTQNSDTSIKLNLSDTHLNDIIKRCTCDKKGGCNTNTIIFPRDHFCGDGVANLESFIRTEAKINSRNLDEILNELTKQRRDIREVRETLDLMVRALREQLFQTTFKGKNGLQDFFDDLDRKTSLERKSNAMSINGKESVKLSTIEVKEAPVVMTAAPEKKKKKGIFSWCS